MGLFGFGKKKDEYDYIYEDDDDIDYSEVDGCEFEDTEEEIEEAINRLRGTIGRGDCICCSARDGMKYDIGGFFFCKECNMIVDEDFYYRWAAGYPAELK